jgi:hypothetical protein
MPAVARGKMACLSMIYEKPRCRAGAPVADKFVQLDIGRDQRAQQHRAAQRGPNHAESTWIKTSMRVKASLIAIGFFDIQAPRNRSPE